MFTILCPCYCGSHVEATDAGFAATTVTVEPCLYLAARGVASSRMAKSAAYAAAVPTTATMAAGGLVAFEAS